MSSRYAQVDRSMWGDEKFRALSGPKPNAQTLFLWLLTSPEVSPIPGMVRMGVAGISEAIDWPVASTKRFLEELSKAGMVKLDAKARLLWLPNALKRNAPRSPDNMKPWDKAWEELPECALKAEAWEAMYSYFQGRGGSILQAFEAKCPHPYVTLRVHPKVDPKGSDSAAAGVDPKGGPPNPDPDPDPNLSPDPDPKGDAPPAEREPEDPSEDDLFKTYTGAANARSALAMKYVRDDRNAQALNTVWGTYGYEAKQTPAEFLESLAERVGEYVADCQARKQPPQFEGQYAPYRFLAWLTAVKAGVDPFPRAPVAVDGTNRGGSQGSRPQGPSSPYGDPTAEDIARMTGRAS